MSILATVKQIGVWGSALHALEHKLGLRVPLPLRLRWLASKKHESAFWERYLETRGLTWREAFAYRTDPRAEVTPDIAELLGDSETLDVLDVGSGPLTSLGKYCAGRKLNLRAVDPLAPEYDAMLRRHGIRPLVPVEKMAAEELSDRLPEDHFDLVFARNCVDHSFDAVRSVLEMLKVVKPGRHVYLKHSQNEAVKRNWKGMHQWNLAVEDGDFTISSRRTRVNFTKEFSHLAETTCTLDEADWLSVRIRKKAAA
jgi:SAM-dependent methyltransferase